MALKFKDIQDWKPTSISIVDSPSHPLAVFEVYENDEEFIKKYTPIEVDTMSNNEDVNKDETVTMPTSFLEKILGGLISKAEPTEPAEPPVKPPIKEEEEDKKDDSDEKLDKIIEKLESYDEKFNAIEERITKIEESNKEPEKDDSKDGEEENNPKDDDSQKPQDPKSNDEENDEEEEDEKKKPKGDFVKKFSPELDPDNNKNDSSNMSFMVIVGYSFLL